MRDKVKEKVERKSVLPCSMECLKIATNLVDKLSNRNVGFFIGSTEESDAFALAPGKVDIIQI